MKLSIITINYNNAAGLKKTLDSVQCQTGLQNGDLEHIIVDGGSTDGSKDIITAYAEASSYPVRWVSEKDNGIYNAINKGIRMANGDYIQVLNSGDRLAAPDVTQRMQDTLDVTSHTSGSMPAILYGNMLRVDAKGHVVGKSGEVPYSLLQYYASTMNHDCCYIRRELFDAQHYGLYDENLKIVSDWKWFLQAIALGNVRPVYTNIDMTLFDTTGISETNLDLRNRERRQVLEELLPPAVLADYDRYAFPMEQFDRLKRHHLYGLVWFVERVLFKFEKWGICRK